jgi:hypothetical protein
MFVFRVCSGRGTLVMLIEVMCRIVLVYTMWLTFAGWIAHTIYLAAIRSTIRAVFRWALMIGIASNLSTSCSCLVCAYIWVTFEVDIGAYQGISGLYDVENDFSYTL